MRYQILTHKNKYDLVDLKYDRVSNRTYASLSTIFDNPNDDPINARSGESFWYHESASFYLDTRRFDYTIIYEFDDIPQFILDHPELFI